MQKEMRKMLFSLGNSYFNEGFRKSFLTYRTNELLTIDDVSKAYKLVNCEHG